MDTEPTPGPAKRPTTPNTIPKLFGKPMGGPAVVLLILLGLAFITVLFREQANAAFQIRPAVPSLSATTNSFTRSKRTT